MENSILILVDWFAPAYKAGGIITACKNFAKQASRHKKVFILTSDCDINNEKLPNISRNVWTEFDKNCFVRYTTNDQMTPGLIKRTISAVKPERIYLNSMFSPRYTLFPLFVSMMGGIKCPITLTTHGMMLPEALRAKSLKKKVFLTLFKMLGIQKRVTFCSNMNEEFNNIRKVLNPPSVELATLALAPAQEDYESGMPEKMPGYLSLAFVGRVHPIKNLFLVLQTLKALPYNIELKIIGALEDKTYWERCSKLIETLPSNIMVKQYGGLPQHAAEELMRQSHALFLPSRTENFCYAVFEALSNGRPVITSDRTPWRNLESIGCGWDISLEEPHRFVDVVEKMVMMGSGEYAEMARNAWLHASRYREDSSVIFTNPQPEVQPVLQPMLKIA